MGLGLVNPARHRSKASPSSDMVDPWLSCGKRGAARSHLVCVMWVGFLSCKMLLCSRENNISGAYSVLAGLGSPGSGCEVPKQNYRVRE